MYLIVNELTAVGDVPPVPFAFRALTASPGPRRVTLELSLPNSGPVDVSLFNVHGRRVARLLQGTLAAGVHPLHWDGTDERGARVGSGIYFARARTQEGTSSLRIVIIE
jgi:flagellar hook assembly protein FlgD